MHWLTNTGTHVSESYDADKKQKNKMKAIFSGCVEYQKSRGGESTSGSNDAT